MKMKYEFNCYLRITGEEYLRTPTIEIESPKHSLLHTIVSAFASKSRHSHHGYSMTRTLISAIKLIDGELKHTLDQKPEQITRSELQSAITNYEKKITLASIGLPTKHAYLNIIRRLISGPTVIADSQTTKTALESLRKRLPKKDRKRTKAILPDLEIDHLQHESPLDLINRSRELTNNRKNQITNAFESELASYNSTIEHQNRMIEQQHSARAHGLHLSSEHQYITGLLEIICFASTEKLSLYLKDKNLIKASLNINQPMAKRYGIASRSNLPWFYARHRLPNSVIFSIFVSILVKTGWNQGSLACMPHTGIKSNGIGGWILQGFKVKTDDDTPFYEVESRDRSLVEGIRLLLWNRTQLINLGVIAEDNLNLWNGWKYTNSEVTTIHLDVAKNRFIRDHGLANFVLNDLRNLTAADLFLTTQNLEDVRLLLGHMDLEQTSEYLDVVLIDSIDKALILEFSKRLEATAIFQFLGPEEFKKRELDIKHIDSRLIFTTSIGTQCSDPSRYPHFKGLSPCDGEHCLCNSGCANHQLVITLDGIIISLRTIKWYKYRWENIYNRNKERFITIDLPRILFITALLSHVSKVRPDIFYQAKDILNAEDQQFSTH